MKIQVAIAAAALAFAASMDSAYGLAKYLNELPNGSSFQQPLGHPGSDSSKTTDFANAFADANHSWTAELCVAKFPGSSMTNGEAFGDPCCTWKKGGKPDFTVTAFTTTPTKATTCATKAGASSAASPTEAATQGPVHDTSDADDTTEDATQGSEDDTTENATQDDASDATQNSTPAEAPAAATPSAGCAAKRTLRR